MESIGFNTGDAKQDYSEAKEKIMASLKDHFRPEFLNRLDEIIMFDILTPEAIRKIVEIQIDIVKKRLQGKEITLHVTSDVISYLAKEGYDPHYGARPLKRLIQNKILTPAASFMISSKVLSGGSISVSMKDNQIMIDVEKIKKRTTKTKKKVVKKEKVVA